MDNNTIAILEDYQSKIDMAFKKIEKIIREFEGADSSQQNLAINSLKKDTANNKTNIGLMKMELSNLKEEANAIKWQEILAELQTKNDNLKITISNLEAKKK